MDNVSDLRILLGSAYPLVFAETKDEQRFIDLIAAEAAAAGLPLWVWSSYRGLAKHGYRGQYGTKDLLAALAFVADLQEPGVFVFADAHSALTDPLALRALKESARAARRDQTIVLTAPSHVVPPELEELGVAWTLKPPTDAEIDALIDRVVRGLAVVDLDPERRRILVRELRGMSLSAIDRIVHHILIRDGRLDEEDLEFARNHRFSQLGGDEILELVSIESRTLDDIGGLDGLKDWLRLRGRAVGSDRAREMGIDAPRGVLLTGVPGCGKSLIAKTIAATWAVPLLLLDPARLYRKYLGESEQRLESALVSAEAMAPTVLWIDEIEKGFATGGDGDGGVSTRVLGTFLRWLQDRKEGVFVIATANDVTRLPPELLRKGRFDEIFFVDLPDAEARRQILVGQLTARGHSPEDFDIARLVDLTSGFSGADIEAMVVGALYRAFGADANPTTEDLVAEAGTLVPLTRARPEDVARLRAWADGRAVKA